jgi:hypothetical protein
MNLVAAEQHFGGQQRAIGRAEDQDVVSHVFSHWPSTPHRSSGPRDASSFRNAIAEMAGMQL